MRSRYDFLIQAGTVLLLCVGVCSAVQPYHPTHPDPVREPWRWQIFPELKGLGLRCLAEDQKGNIWFGTGEDVRRYDGVNWTVFTPEDGLYGAPVVTLCATRDGSLYAGTTVGISRYRGGAWSRVFPPAGLLTWPTYELKEARNGSLWAATGWGALCLGAAGDTLYTDRGNGALIRAVAPYVEVREIPDGVVPSYAWPRSIRVGIMTGTEGVIWALAAGSPEAAAGIRLGDRVVAIDGSPEVSMRRLNGPEGAEVKVAVQRAGYPDLLEVTLPRRRVEGTYTNFWLSDVLQARDGTLWFGIYEQGQIVRYDPSADRESGSNGSPAWRVYTAQDGLDPGFRPAPGSDPGRCDLDGLRPGGQGREPVR